MAQPISDENVAQLRLLAAANALENPKMQLRVYQGRVFVGLENQGSARFASIDGKLVYFDDAMDRWRWMRSNRAIKNPQGGYLIKWPMLDYLPEGHTV